MVKQRLMKRDELVARAAVAVGMSYQKLGERLSVSKRTVARWVAGDTSPVDADLAKLAIVVHPHDAELAKLIAVTAGESLESLGLVAEPAPPPPAPPPPPRARLVDAVVCAAADAVSLPPSAVRPALVAAFACARELGLTYEQIEATLAEARSC